VKARAVPVTFDEQSHRYRVAGHEVISVTTVLKAAGHITGDQFYTEAARQRGKCVHHACMNLDLGVAHGCRHSAHHGFIESYVRWKELIAHQWDRIEEPGYSDAYGIAGIADRVGTVKGCPALVDLKTGGVQPWHPLQFALYDLIYDDVPPRVRRRIGLYLREDGRTAHMLPFNDPSDHDRALWAVRRATT